MCNMIDEINYCTSCGRELTAFSACRVFAIKQLFSGTVRYTQACPHNKSIKLIYIFDGESVTIE